MPLRVNPIPVLAGTIVAVLVAGTVLVIVRPGDLGGEGRSDATGPTTTAPVGQAAPDPQATDVPRTTTPSGSTSDDASGTATTAPSPVPTTGPVPGPPTTAPASPPTPTTTAPVPDGSPAPTPGSDPSGGSQAPPILAHTGGSDVLAPLAVVLLLAGTAGRLALRSSAPSPRFWRQQRSGD